MSARLHSQPVRRGRALQRGLSLIELMIAIALGVVLMLGMVEVFGTTRAVYQTTSALARIQEGGRFAMDFVRSDLRMAGQWGCFNEYQPLRRFYNHTATSFGPAPLQVPVESTAPWPYRTDIAIEGFEYENTAPGENVTVTSMPGVASAASRWSPTLPTTLATAVGDANAPAVANSDIFVVRYAEADYVPLKGGTSLAAGLIAVNPTDSAFMQQGRVYVITDCRQISLFQANTAPTNVDVFPTSPGNEAAVYAAIGGGSLNVALPGSPSGPGWNELDYFGSNTMGEGSPIHRYRMAFYYVALPTGETAPSLYRRELTLNATNQMILGAPQRLVDGVESMQLTYGVSAALSSSISDLQGLSAGNYVTARTLVAGQNNNTTAAYTNAMRRIKKVRVALLLKGTESAGVQGGSAAYNVGDVMFRAPATDTNLRSVYEAVVTVRNRY